MPTIYTHAKTAKNAKTLASAMRKFVRSSELMASLWENVYNIMHFYRSPDGNMNRNNNTLKVSSPNKCLPKKELHEMEKVLAEVAIWICLQHRPKADSRAVLCFSW